MNEDISIIWDDDNVYYYAIVIEKRRAAVIGFKNHSFVCDIAIS